MIHPSQQDILAAGSTAADIIRNAKEIKARFAEAGRERARADIIARRQREQLARINAEIAELHKSNARADLIRLQKIDENAALLRRHRQNSEQAEEIKRLMTELGVGYRASMSRIIQRICGATGVAPTEIFSRRRTRDVAFARQAIMYWSARLTPLSYPQIGARLGGLDHTTALHGARRYPEKRRKMGRKLRPIGSRSYAAYYPQDAR